MTTKVVTPAIQQPTAVPANLIYRLSVEQYHEMARRGILTEDDPVELLEGWLVIKVTKNPPHRIATHLTRKALEDLLPKGWYVDSQEPITTDDSEPEPDVVVVRGDTREYPDRHPAPTDIAMVVEVADDSLHRDRTLKKRLYARAGIPIYWIVNLLDKRVEVYTQPVVTEKAADYRQQVDYGPSDMIPLIIGGKEVGRMAVRDLLP